MPIIHFSVSSSEYNLMMNGLDYVISNGTDKSYDSEGHDHLYKSIFDDIKRCSYIKSRDFDKNTGTARAVEVVCDSKSVGPLMDVVFAYGSVCGSPSDGFDVTDYTQELVDRLVNSVRNDEFVINH